MVTAKPTIVQLPKIFDETLGKPDFNLWALSKLTLEEYAVYRALADLPVPDWSGTMQDLADYLNIGYHATSWHVRRLHKKKFIGWYYTPGCSSTLYWVRTSTTEERPNFKPEFYKIVDQNGKVSQITRGQFSRFAEKHDLTPRQVSNLLSGKHHSITSKTGDRYTRA